MMFIICFCYASVMLSLLFFRVTAMFLLELFLIFNSFFLKQEYVNKELFIEAMVRSKKRKRIKEFTQGVHLNTWLTAVKEAAFVLVNIETDKITSPRARSR